MTRCLLVLALLGAAACPNSAERCEEICDWYLGYCDEDRDTCMEDCQWADPEVFEEAGACLDSTPMSCRAASCCVEFAYDEYNYERECL